MVKNHKVSKTKYSLMKMENEIRKRYGLPRQGDHPESAKTMGGKTSGSSVDEGRALRENIEWYQIKYVKEKALRGKFFKYLNEPFVDKEASLVIRSDVTSALWDCTYPMQSRLYIYFIIYYIIINVAKQQYFRIISEGSREIDDWSNDGES